MGRISDTAAWLLAAVSACVLLAVISVCITVATMNGNTTNGHHLVKQIQVYQVNNK